MILNSIILHNFGVYAGRQRIELTPHPEKPVILFGGLNGGGKTTFLDAIQLCLFGSLAKCSNRANFAYDEYLKRCINKSARDAEAALELSFTHREDGDENQYVLHRSWKAIEGKIKETFEVVKNGKFDQALTENWHSQVEDFIPLNISSLFLFDGEKIESYASKENSAALIQTAIQNLLGLDIVDQLQKDLVIFERRKKSAEAPVKVKQRLEEEEGKIQFLHERLLSIKQEIASIKTHKIEAIEKKLSQAEKEFSKKGGKLYEQRAEIEKAYNDSKANLIAVLNELKEASATALPLMLVEKLSLKMLDTVEGEELSRISQDMSKLLAVRDRHLLQFLKKHRADKDAVNTVHRFIGEDTKDRKRQAQQPILIDLPQQSLMRLREFLNSGSQSLVKDTKTLLKKYSQAKNQFEKNELEFHSVPKKENLRELEAKVRKLKEQLVENQSQYSSLSLEGNRVAAEVDKRKQSLARLSEQNVLDEVGSQDDVRMLKHSEKARKTLDDFKKKVVGSHLAIIENLILESYQQLIRKSSFISQLKINPETFDIELYSGNGQSLSPERLSAGERQLLAISILWGLAKASGRPLPTAIDTPLGRLDSIHRENIVRRYFPFASHQVLLFSTDQEIVGGYLDGLKPWIGRSYVLDYNSQRHSTEIREGYFKLAGAA